MCPWGKCPGGTCPGGGGGGVFCPVTLLVLSLYLFQFGDVCNKGDSGTFVFGVFGLGAGEDTYNVEVKTQAFLPYRLDLSLISQTKGLVTN